MPKTSCQAAGQLFNSRIEKAMGGAYYTPPDTDTFITESIKDVATLKRRGKEYVYNCPASFDIETTSFYRTSDAGQEKAAIMYVWQFGLNGNVLIGRTWEEFAHLCDRLVALLELGPGVRHLLVYVHNLEFEMGFIQFRFAWQKVFALDSRRPVYAITTGGIEFRCSYILSGFGLDMLGKNLITYKVNKLTGSFDYSLMRNSATDLTQLEIQYCINDALVVMAYIQERIETDGGITRILLTKTSYVRKLVRDNCLYGGAGSHNSKVDKGVGNQYRYYHRMMSHLTLTPDEYRQAKRGFQGGFTHANGFAVNRVYRNVTSYDFTSSYPAVMVAEQYPMTRGEEYTPTSYEDFIEQNKYYCCLYDIELFNVRASFCWEHYISKSRCIQIDEPVVDNGRVVSAARVLMTITNVDFDIIQRTYEYDRITVYNFRRYYRNYLPKEYINTILDLYEDKTTLKGLTSEDGTIERRYQASKANLNALYGMSVMDICRPEITFDGSSWVTNAPDIDDMVDKYNKSKTRFNSYLWGVFVTAYARRNLWSAILNIGPDYLYSDTDSVKIINADKHREYFERYNNDIVRKLNAACAMYNIDPERTRPANSKGIKKQLGVWDEETDGIPYTRFKTLGAKRYLTQDGDGLHLTVAGLGKKPAVEYLLYKYKTPEKVFDAFCDDLEIPAEYERGGEIINATGKNTHTYIDYAYTGRMTDYQGHNVEYKELSGIHLEPAAYGLSLADEYVSYLMGIGSIELMV